MLPVHEKKRPAPCSSSLLITRMKKHENKEKASLNMKHLVVKIKKLNKIRIIPEPPSLKTQKHAYLLCAV